MPPMLIACSACHRQYDVRDLAPGSRVRCACGELSTVPQERAARVRMLHCSNCGGKVDAPDAPCAYCNHTPDPNARYTEACPGCLHQLAEGARYCNSCGVKIDPVGVVRAVADESCPRCGRDLMVCETEERAFHQCTGCAGLWLSADVFDGFLREQEAGVEAGPPLPGELPRALITPVRRGAAKNSGRRRRKVPLFRCPVCARVMLRKNFAELSQVVVDRCKSHGWWLDEGELERIASFIERGGLEVAKKRFQDGARRRRSAARRRRNARKRREQASGAGLIGVVAMLAALG